MSEEHEMQSINTTTLLQPTDAQIDAAAKVLAECMDYPWEHMPKQGRDNMRKNARAVLAAAQPAPVPADMVMVPRDILVRLVEEATVFEPAVLDPDALAQARRILSAPPAPVPVPPGWKLVPVEPTPEMITAGERSGGYGGFSVEDCYCRMIAASPEVP